ncbi:TPA: hypothetical protein DD449_04365 [Candidatus Berkelbacteria bacterium]|uniref:phosphate acyltransferase n=1 Tax=Berkelbacteria bacterium GW2011_GWE1_39_12 TaxID=1618337 RepID=A0A0G4B4H0_9BACT|nr:MAG: hypothetical protein UT28_C0001G0493 [Berkelbacteria bacterium GW2011_GWE1_39_12]HBO60889.1 hypothetical protein [Candidatus Berkelbacteria bacterium]
MKPLRIGTLATAGDYGAQEVIKAAILASRYCSPSNDFDLVVYAKKGSSEGFSMDDMGRIAYYETGNTDTSEIRAAFEALRRGDINAIVTPKNSHDLMAMAKNYMNPDIERPGLIGGFPTMGGIRYVTDIGATSRVDDPKVFAGLAELGRDYLIRHCGIASPRIGLHNISTEHAYPTLQRAYELLDGFPGFVGYAEPAKFWAGEIDLLLIDGFGGNSKLKDFERIGLMTVSMCADALSKAGYFDAAKALPGIMKARLSYDSYLISLLLGPGWVFRTHGNCKAEQLAKAFAMAVKHPIQEPY